MVQNRFKEAENCRELLKTTRILRINFCCVWFEYLIFSAASLSRLRPVNVLRDNRQFHVRTHRFLCSVPPPTIINPLFRHFLAHPSENKGEEQGNFPLIEGFISIIIIILRRRRENFGGLPPKNLDPIGKALFLCSFVA